MSRFEKNKNKKKKKRGKRRNDSSSSDDEPTSSTSSPTSSPSRSPASNRHKKLSFKEQKELQRKQKEERRRAKQKCRLCGRAGHIRRECPGISDGGAGASKYKQKGKISTSKNSKRGSKHRGNKDNKDNPTNNASTSSSLAFPLDFTTEDPNNDNYFPMIDCGTNVASTIAHITSLQRGMDAKRTYASMLSGQTCPYYSGVISQYMVPKARPWNIGGPHWLKQVDARVFFVVGVDVHIDPVLVPDMLKDILSDPCVVGLYVVLEYENAELEDKQLQMARLKSMCVAAQEHQVPLQVHIAGAPKPAPVATLTMPAGPTTPINQEPDDPYLEAMKALVQQLLTCANNDLALHLSSWCGHCDAMMKLLQAFPSMMIGMHGGVSFTKATALHACAYDVPLDRLLLETGLPQYIPAQVSKRLGREAINHSGLLPFVAEAIATHKTTKHCVVKGIDVARASSKNSLTMYPRLLNTLPVFTVTKPMGKHPSDPGLQGETKEEVNEALDDMHLLSLGTTAPEEKDCYYATTNKTYAVVTGGNRGLGLALMAPLLSEDLSLHVFMGCRTLAAGVAAVKSLPTPFHSRITPLLLDVTSDESLAAAYATVVAVASNGLALLINNAGVLDVGDNDVEDVYAVNFQGVLNTTTTFLPLLCTTTGIASTIINTSSSCGVRFLASLPSETQAQMLSATLTTSGLIELLAVLVYSTPDIYSLTKLGVNMYTLILSRKHTADRLRVLAVSPGFTNTDMCKDYDGDRVPKEVELGASVFWEAMHGIGRGQSGIFIKQNDKAGTAVEDAKSVVTDWK